MTKSRKLNKIILNFLFLLVVAGNIFSESNAAAQSETVTYPPLRAQMNQWDCDDAKAPRETFCRVKRMPAADKVGKQLGGGAAGAWSESDTLTIAYQAKADSVEVIVGGATFPMAQIGGTDLWTIVLKAPWLDSGIVSYRFIVVQGSDTKLDPPASQFVWRGASAPVPPAKSEALQGKITEEIIQSTNLSEPRKLTVYSPPLQRKGEKPAVVIYVADGGNVNGLAPYIDGLIVSQKLPPVLLVGVHPGEQLRDPDPRIADVRGIEYLIGFGKTPERFEKHERFFVNEVTAWAESKYNAPKQREKRGIYGVSNSGAFAIAMGTRHFGTFGHVFGFSSSFQYNLLAPEWSGKQPAPRYYLLIGLWEFRLRGLSPYAEVLRKSGARVTYVEPVAEHDATMWKEQFTKAILLHFGKKPSAD